MNERRETSASVMMMSQRELRDAEADRADISMDYAKERTGEDWRTTLQQQRMSYAT